MVSSISGPIPPHPCYETSDPQTYWKLPPARVRPEAEDKVRQGSGLLCLALEVDGLSMSSAQRKTSMKCFELIFGI